MWDLLIWITLFIGSYIIIYFAADLFLDNLKIICMVYNLSPLITGMLVLGIDPEESIASIISAFDGLPYISMGNVVGNSIIAMTLPFAIALVAKPIKVRPVSSFYIILIFVMLINIFLGFMFNLFLFISGFLALIFYIIYFLWNIKHYSKKQRINGKFINLLVVKNGEEVETPQGVAKLKKILLVIIGFIFIFLGGELLIFSADKILEIVKISELFFGFIVIGFVTNVEELTLVVKSIKKEATEIGIGGMIGKVIWNLGFTYGISSIIIINMAFSMDLMLNLLILFLVFISYSFFLRKALLKRWYSLILWSIFILFLSFNFYTI